MMKFQKYRLEEVCVIQIGKTPRREVSKYWGKGYSWASISDMKTKFITSTKEEITETAIRECGCKLIPKGTLLLSFKLSIGKLAFAGKDLFTNEAIVGLQIKAPKLLHPEYLFYVLKNIPLVGSNNAAMGSTLNKESLRILEMPVPSSIEDQHYIVKILSQAESLIAQRKESIHLLDEFLRSFFLEMFGDPINNGKNWKTERLDKISKLERGRFSPRPRNDPSYYNGKYPFIQTGDISKSENRLNSYSQTLNEKGIKVSKEFKKEVIVIAIVGATIGATAILEIDVYATDSVIGITPNKIYTNNIFLEFTFRFWKPVLFKIAPQAARANINLDILSKLQFILPPINLQSQFARIVKKVEFQKTLCQQSLHELENLYGSLSQKAFKGELLTTTTQNLVVSAQISQEVEEKHFLKRKVLATYIINQSLKDSQFGVVKFEKLLHLSDYFAIKRNLNQNYLQKAAGPYDNAFTIPFFKQIETSKWFTRNKIGTRYVFRPGQKHDKSINTYGYFNDEELQKVNRLINYFKNSDYEQPEIISTLYAVWNNRIARKQSITDDLLKRDFLSWDTQKMKYKDRLDSALKWMRKEELVPDGWGKVIEKPKSKRNGK